jgi:uncharacterized protein
LLALDGDLHRSAHELAYGCASLVAPTLLQIVHGTTDTALLPEYAQEAYEAALGPKELVWIEAHNHIELYDQDPYVSEAASHAIRWLDRQLADR